jgi:cell division initiation protein
MKISPISIKKHEFSKKMRGYDTEEVHAFLEKLADDVEDLQKENETLKKQIEEASVRLNEFTRIEKNLQNTLLRAQESAAKAVESTKRQTSLMIKEAEIKASQILEKARENTNEVRTAVINLREEKNLIIAKLKSIVTSQAHLLAVKVESAGEESVQIKPLEQAKSVDIDVDDVLSKIL